MPLFRSMVTSPFVATLLAGVWIASSSIATEAGLDECLDGYKELARKPAFRAMAVSSSANLCHSAWGFGNQWEANRAVLAECKKRGSTDCRLLDAKQDIAALKERQKQERARELETIVEVQTMLRALGLYSGEIDGKRGPATIAAIKKVQRQSDLVEDGSISIPLLSVLRVRTTQTKDASAPLGSSSAVDTARKSDKSVCRGAYSTLTSDWDSSPMYANYVREAVRRGLSLDVCRSELGIIPIAANSSPVSNDELLALSDKQLCRGAYNVLSANWDGSRMFYRHVLESKRRGLTLDDCRVAIGLEPKATVVEADLDVDVASLCKKALNGPRSSWDTSTTYAAYVSEAKRRDLSADACRVAIGLDAKVPETTKVKEKPKPDREICAAALVPARTQFSALVTYKADVDEAKRRGLSVDDCRTAMGLSPLASPTSEEAESVQSAPPTQKLLTLTEVCEQALNLERTGWDGKASSSQARQQADALGITVDACRSQLGLDAGVNLESNTTEVAKQTSPKDSDKINPSIVLHRKVALVIGNSAYEHTSALANPHNDAEAVVKTLAALGFEVISGLDLSNAGTVSKVREFAKAAKTADVSLLYYAGHGLQIAGENYIVPVDAKVEDETAISFELINVSTITNFMGGLDKVGIILLDACRDNPFSRSLKRSLSASRAASVEQGLAPISAEGGGLFVAFATAPGDVAADGEGMINSPFTTALIKHLPTKGIEINTVMTRVKAEVARMTKNDQRPWTNSDLTTEVYLAPAQ